MVLLYQYISLINVTNISFQYQCCDTYCTFPGESCDRSRDEFCVCKKCTCSNDSTLDEEPGECKAHCNIEKLLQYSEEEIQESENDESKKETEDCALITCVGIVSFCGNVLGIALGILLAYRNCRSKKHSNSLDDLTKPPETDSLMGRKDSGINEESGDESGTTLKHFNTRRILTSVADNCDIPSKVLVSGRHDDINMTLGQRRDAEDEPRTSAERRVITESPGRQTVVDITSGKSEVQCIVDA